MSDSNKCYEEKTEEEDEVTEVLFSTGWSERPLSGGDI